MLDNQTKMLQTSDKFLTAILIASGQDVISSNMVDDHQQVMFGFKWNNEVEKIAWDWSVNNPIRIPDPKCFKDALEEGECFEPDYED